MCASSCCHSNRCYVRSQLPRRSPGSNLKEVPMTTTTATESTFRRPEGVKVTFRRMLFPFEDAGFDRYWHSGSPFKSLFWTQLSTAFDAGEKFFIDSARALRTEVQDPKLLEELAEFCKQAGHHTARSQERRV